MAINKIVYYAEGRHLRITVNAGPRHTQRYRVERDLILIKEFSTLGMLEIWLRENGIDFADLEQD
jgi:hypothetical protein